MAKQLVFSDEARRKINRAGHPEQRLLQELEAECSDKMHERHSSAAKLVRIIPHSVAR